MAKVTFDPVNKLIIVNSGVTELNVKVDLYSVAKELWKTDSTLNKFRFPFRVIGGDPIGPGLYAGAFFFLQNQAGMNWRIRPFEGNHELLIKGNLYSEDTSLPMFVPTVGDYTVSIKLERASLTQLADPILDQTEKQEIATEVWAHTVGSKVSNDVSVLKKIETGRWRIVNNQLIFYDTDKVTPLIIFNLKDRVGKPTETEPFEREPVQNDSNN